MANTTSHSPSGSKILRGLIITIFIVVAGVMVMRVMVKSRKKPKRKPPARLSLKVKVQAAQRGTKTLYLKGFGTTQAQQRIEIVPEVAGKITRILSNFKPGTYVRKGAVLFRIDSQPYRLTYKQLRTQIYSLRKQIKTSQAALQMDQKNLSRNQALFQKKVIAQNAIDSLQTRYLDRKQRLESLQQALQIARVQIQTARLNLRRTTIRAPFSARIVQGNLVRGSYVAPGRPVAVLESTSQVELPVAFPIGSLYNIRNSQGRSISFQRLPTYLRGFPSAEIRQAKGQAASWQGRVVRVGARVDPRTRMLELWLRVTKNNERTLLPGVFCSVAIPYQRIRDAIAIPNDALYGSKVYLMEKGRLQIRQVIVAHRDSETAYIRSGINDGDLVIVSPLSDPVEGTPVFRSN